MKNILIHWDFKVVEERVWPSYGEPIINDTRVRAKIVINHDGTKECKVKSNEVSTTVWNDIFRDNVFIMDDDYFFSTKLLVGSDLSSLTLPKGTYPVTIVGNEASFNF